jgi:hypothetical protein
MEEELKDIFGLKSLKKWMFMFQSPKESLANNLLLKLKQQIYLLQLKVVIEIN